MEENLTEDEMLIRAMEESLRHFEEVEKPYRQLLEINEPSSSEQPNHQVKENTKSAPITEANSSSPFVFKAVPSTSNQVNSRSDTNSSTTEKTVPKAQLFKRPSVFTVKAPSAKFKFDNSKPSTSNSAQSSSSGALWQEYGSRAGPSTSKATSTSVSSKKSQAASGSSSSTAQSSSASLWQEYGSESAFKETVKKNVPSRSETDNRIEITDPLQLISEEKSLTEDGFCMFTGRHWVYPVNFPERKYQLDMVQTALFHNTLVCLPTGLGKTFIAAVVMYNFYRWYPKGKIIFMAPTKPLVAQQIKACYDVTGIPKSDTEEMTGAANPERRTQAWKKKRVFFATPQVVANDLVAQICPAEEVRCLVVDEAHRAQGNYSYCQVINNLRASTQYFRILALSATPGSDINAVKQVLENLHISKLKIATEDSPDVAQYTHHRELEVIQVSPTTELNEARERFIAIMDKYLQPLAQNSIISAYNVTNITQFQMKTNMDKFMRNPPNWLSPSEVSRMQTYCLISITLSHANELLQNYGIRSFLSYIQGVLQDSKTNKFVLGHLSKNEALLELIEEYNERLGNKTNKNNKKEESKGGSRIIYGHPKMQKLQEITVNHFLEFEDRNEKTRAIIFCQYRDSVEEIRNILAPLEPIVKAMSFVGQAKSKGSGGLTQKQQLQVMRDFRSGDFNTLISTCVGEEGLDIGEVDLIICVDASKSPVRLVQRMGRTGRKRAGRIVMLLSEGKEYKKYIDSTRQQSTISKAIMNNQQLIPILNQIMSPRMVPKGLNPEIHRSVLVIPQIENQQDIRNAMRKVPAAIEAVSVFPSAAELAKWDGTVPEFKNLDLVASSDLLSFASLDAIFPLNETQHQLDNNGSDFKFERWLEWQRNLQGVNLSYHSCDTEALTALLQLADRLNLNNTALLTQTADLVSKVDHDKLWEDAKKKGKGRGKKSTKEVASVDKGGDIARFLQQQGQNRRLPKVPDAFFTQTDVDEFQLPRDHIPKPYKNPTVPLPAELLKSLEYLKLENNHLNENDPFNKLFVSLHTVSHSFRKIKNKHFQPDLTIEPLDISELDKVFNEMKLKKGPTVKVDIFKTEQITILPVSKYLRKRKVAAPDVPPQPIVNEVHLEPILKVSVQQNDMHQESGEESSDESSKVEPVDTTSVEGGISPGMKEFLMNFDEDFDEFEVNKITPPDSENELEAPVTTREKKELKNQNLSVLNNGKNELVMNFDGDFREVEDMKIDLSDDKLSKLKKNAPSKNTPTVITLDNSPKRNNERKHHAFFDDSMDELLVNFDEDFKEIDDVKVAQSDSKPTKLEKNTPEPSRKPPTVITLDNAPKENKETKHQNVSNVSDSMNKMLMNFDLEFDEDEIVAYSKQYTTSKKPPESISENKNNIKNIATSNIDTKSKPQSSNQNCDVNKKDVVPSVSTNKLEKLNFDILDDDDLFADIDVSVWMGEIEKKSAAMKQTGNLISLSKSPSVASSLPTSSSPNTPIVKKTTDTIKIPDTSFSKRSPDIFASDFTDTPSPAVKQKACISINSAKAPAENEVLSSTASSLLKKESTKMNPKSPILFGSSSSSPSLSVNPLENKENVIKSPTINNAANVPKKVSKLSLKNKEKLDVVTKRITDSQSKSSAISEDISFIQLQRKGPGRRKAVILSSDEEDSQEAADVKSSPKLLRDKDDERDNSTDITPTQLISISSDSEHSSDDAFTQLAPITRKRKSLEELRRKPKKVKKSWKANEFLDNEAEVSGEVGSEDEQESSQMDKYEESFINNFTQADPSVDIQAQYLRSVRSPVQGKFKIPEMNPGRRIMMSPTENNHDDSSYMNDSFCVDSDEDREEESEELLDELEAELEMKNNRKKKRKELSSDQDEEEEKLANKAKGKRLKRIIVHSQNSSDDELGPALLPPRASSTPQQKSAQPPVASSTQQKITGFEEDYVAENEDIETIMARFATQEAEEQKSKKPSSRSLFQQPQQEIQDEVEKLSDSEAKNPPEPSNRQLPNINAPSTSRSKLSVYKNKPTLSVQADFKSETSALKNSGVAPKKMLSMPKTEKVQVPTRIPEASHLNNSTSTRTTDVQNLQRDSEKQTLVAVLPQNKPTLSLAKRNEATSSRQPADPASKPAGKSNQSVVIASTRQVVSAPNLLMVLRKQNVNLVIKTLPSGVDFAISQRLAVGRVPIQEVSSCSEQSDLVADVRSLRYNFKYAVLLLENNASRPVPDPRGNNWETIRHAPPGSRQLKTVLGLLRKVDGLKVVFSKDQAETANIIQKLAIGEARAGFGIFANCKESSDSEFDMDKQVLNMNKKL